MTLFLKLHVNRFSLCVLFFLLSFSSAQAVEVLLKPFYLLASQTGDINKLKITSVAKLKADGFDIVGEYSPYAGVVIVLFTSEQLKQAAAQTKFGVYAAMQRISFTQSVKGVQIAFTNPTYMANVYRLKSDLSAVTDKLIKTLSAEKEYGPDKGLSAKALRDYQYKWLMPYFDDWLLLAEYKTYQQAVQAVENSLAAGKGNTAKVARVDLTDKQATIFAVNLKGGSDDDIECSADKYIMQRIDFKKIRSSAHLPYEIVVVGNKAYALPAEFRIAINFPDLSMMGSNSFASIMCAPTSIKTALTLAAGGSIDDDD